MWLSLCCILGDQGLEKITVVIWQSGMLIVMIIILAMLNPVLGKCLIICTNCIIKVCLIVP